MKPEHLKNLNQWSDPAKEFGSGSQHSGQYVEG